MEYKAKRRYSRKDYIKALNKVAKQAIKENWLMRGLSSKS